jgi:hypothetical protein
MGDAVGGKKEHAPLPKANIKEGEKAGHNDTEVYNVKGSSAGASSAAFHVYQQSRNKEKVRIEGMMVAEKEALLTADFNARREKNAREALERTRKNAAKRNKKKRKREEFKHAAKIAKLKNEVENEDAQREKEGVEDEDEA